MSWRMCTISLAAVVLVVPSVAAGAVAWVGDFETGDLSQWGYVLNGEVDGTPYIVVGADPVAEGRNAARIELHNDAVWPNGLKRVELQHQPDDGRTAEGATTYFAWSFYLPETLPEDPSQTIGYWETAQSYQQMMAFDVSGERITFATRQPQNMVHWQADGIVTAGTWHRIAMRVLWSTDPKVGEVDVWFDGDQVVTAAAAATLADANPTFVQLGLLRGAFEFDDVPVIVLDHALEGDSLEDVEYDALPGRGGDDTGTGSGGDETGAPGDDDGGTTGGPGGADDSDGPGGDDGGPDGGPADDAADDAADAAGTAATAATDDGSASDDDRGGCGCTVPTPRGGTSLLALLALGCRRRRRPGRCLHRHAISWPG